MFDIEYSTPENFRIVYTSKTSQSGIEAVRLKYWIGGGLAGLRMGLLGLQMHILETVSAVQRDGRDPDGPLAAVCVSMARNQYFLKVGDAGVPQDRSRSVLQAAESGDHRPNPNRLKSDHHPLTAPSDQKPLPAQECLQ